MNTFIKRRAAACLFMLCALLGTSASVTAADIVLVNNDGVGEGFNDSSPAVPGQPGNTGATLGEQRLQVFQAAADYWEARLVVTIDVRVGINFDPLTCQFDRGTLGSAGAATLFRDFSGAPMASTWYVAALANNLAGSRLSSDPNGVDINATFNSSIDNNNNCLQNTNWWLGINSPAPSGTISLFETVLHEIGHGLGVSSGIRQNGQLLSGFIDAYSYYLYDETQDEFWRNLTVAQRVTSATNTGNVTFRGPNVMSNTNHVTTGKNGGQLQIYAPNPYRGGSSISHWDTALMPDELMEPSATPTSDDRATLQMLKDIGWQLVQDQGGPPPVIGIVSLLDDQLRIVEDESPLTINLQRTGGSDQAVSVRIRSQGITATANADYTIIDQVVSWADGETGIKSVNLAVNDDSANEGDETLDVILTDPTGGVTLGNADVRVTISDPALIPVPGRVEFVAATQSAGEDAGSANVQIQRVGGDDGRLEVSVRFIDDTATQPFDYAPPISTNIVWLDGESGTRNLSVTIIDDADIEGNESTELILNAVTSGASVSSSRLRLTIIDNDQASPPPPLSGSIEFVSTSLTVGEADSTVAIQLQRVNGSDGQIEVDLNFFDDTATGALDYTVPSSTRFSWNDGQTGVRSINLTIIDDAIDENNETTELAIRAITSGASVNNTRLRLTITDNDDTPPPPVSGNIQFVENALTVDENDGSVAIQLRRVNGTAGRIEVDLDFFDTTASVTSDYTLPNSTRFVWEDGQSGIRNINLGIVEDTLVEGEEFTEMLIRSISGGASISSNRLRLTITDNDPTPSPSPSPSPPADEEFDVLQAIVPILGAINAQKAKQQRVLKTERNSQNSEN